MPKKKKPTKTFNKIGDFLEFALESNKRYASDTLYNDTMDGTLRFTDGSYAECEYEAGSSSASGTWWPGSLDIKYYEPG